MGLMSFPWLRSYTLNVDDLMEKVGDTSTVGRSMRCISAMSDSLAKLSDEFHDVVHLNGTLDDVPDKITFSRTQYTQIKLEENF